MSQSLSENRDVVKACLISVLFHVAVLVGIIFTFNIPIPSPRPFFFFLGPILQKQDFSFSSLGNNGVEASLDLGILDPKTTSSLLSPTVVPKPTFNSVLPSVKKKNFKQPPVPSPKEESENSNLKPLTTPEDLPVANYVPLRLYSR